MNIKVSTDYLPSIYEKYLELYDKGVPVNSLGFKRVSGGPYSTVDYFIKLYNAIKTNGYREVGECKYRNDIKPGSIVPIEGWVDSHGYLIIDGGYHRISILKYLGYKNVTITLHNIDPSFKKFYKYILGFQQSGTQMYHSIDHWACSSWPSARGLNRAELILSRMSPKATVLDLGCHIGGISHPLSVEGYKVTGVELGKKENYCANYIADHYTCRDEVKKLYPLQLGFLPSLSNYCKPLYLLGNVANVINDIGEFDYTLFLSIYRWVGQSSKVLKRIGEITRKSIFIDVEPHLEGSLKQNILKFTRFKHIDKIGVENVGSKMGRSYNKPRTIYEIH